jgi:hypothetical protein
MSLNNLPASIQAAIQQGYLEHEFREPLYATFAYRTLATREPFMANIGETLTKTKTALLPTITTPSSTTANTDLDNGMSAQSWALEQYIMGLNQYKGTMDLNMMFERFAIAGVFLQNARKLGEQAARSVETLAQQALYNTQLGQNTRVLTTLGAPGTTVAVDDIRGFGNSWTSTNVPVTVSSSNPLSVTFVRAGAYSNGANSANTVGGTYSLTGVTPDGSNISTAPGGISGTLTFSSNVAVADGTLSNGVVAAVAPVIQRPFQRATTKQLGAGDVITMQQILQAKAILESNRVPTFNNGMYRLVGDPTMFLPLYQDQAFQRFQIGHTGSEEYRRGVIAQMLGVELVQSVMTPVQASLGGGAVHRGLLCGADVIIESDWTDIGYNNVRNTLDEEELTVIDGIAHITRPPLDRLGQIIAQSWTYVGGFVAPTDLGTTTSTIPTATNSAWKRGIVLEVTAS